MKRFITTILIGTVLLGRGAVADDRSPQQKRVDRAIASALVRLARLQNASGAWSKAVRPGIGRRAAGQQSTGMTSLAVMAFLAAGHVPGEGPYGEVVNRAVRWVVDQQQVNGPHAGLLVSGGNGHGAMYEHGISTLMLAEVVGMLDDDAERRVQAALERAVTLILRAQFVPKSNRDVGGWRYNATTRESDLSVTGWQLLALRAAKDVGCDVPAENIDMAVDYVRRCSVGNRGFTYQPTNNFRDVTATRSGTGILCLEVCGRHHAAESLGAAENLLTRPLNANDTVLLRAYYCTVGMFKVGDKYWTATRDHVVEVLLQLQNADGSWYKANGGEVTGGVVYCTSLSVLALAVEYQYLPIYQR